MSEKVDFYRISDREKFEDYFRFSLPNGKDFLWRNFGQIIRVDGVKASKLSSVDISGETFITQVNLEKYDVEKPLENWYVNAFDICYGDEPMEGEITVGDHTIKLIANKEWDTRSEDLPEKEYFYWVNNWKYFQEYTERTNQLDEDAVDYINNWRRPELKTNAPIKLVVRTDFGPSFVGIPRSETRKTYLDACYRLIHYLREIDGV